MFKQSMVVLFLSLMIVACRGGIDTSKPPEIFYGEDICEECGMIITEPKYAAAYYTKNGEVRGFDDIGGLCLYHNKHQEDVETFWVHDFDSEAWLNTEDAYFVLSKDLYTPMGHGTVAFSDFSRANEMASQVEVEVMSFSELMEHYSETETEPIHDSHGHDHDSTK